MVVFSDDSWKDFSIRDDSLRTKYATAGIYNKEGRLISKISKHMWGAVVTDFGIGFGLGQWALKGDYNECGYFVCKNNETNGIRVKDFISDPSKLPTSISHYESILTLRYFTDLKAVVIITLDSKAIIYNAKTGEIGDLASRMMW